MGLYKLEWHGFLDLRFMLEAGLESSFDCRSGAGLFPEREESKQSQPGHRQGFCFCSLSGFFKTARETPGNEKQDHPTTAKN